MKIPYNSIQNHQDCVECGERGCLTADSQAKLFVKVYYTWNQSGKKFQRRKQGIPVDGWPNVFASEALGRIYMIHPNNSDCFYLRLQLVNIRNPTSFGNLRTVNGYVCQTYHEACN
jgi:hypothetical protein